MVPPLGDEKDPLVREYVHGFHVPGPVGKPHQIAVGASSPVDAAVGLGNPVEGHPRVALQIVPRVGQVETGARAAASPVHVLPVPVPLVDFDGGVERSGGVQGVEVGLVARVVVGPNAARIPDPHGQAAGLVQDLGERHGRAVQTAPGAVSDGKSATEG